MKIQTAAITDPGLVRAHNEDAYYVSSNRRLLAVADGMGGEVGGAVASKLAVETLENLWKTSEPGDDGNDIVEWTASAADTANGIIFNVSHSDPGLTGMGTTLVYTVLCSAGTARITHVGDSRAYLISEGEIKLLTNDHSTVQELVHAGKMTEQEARHSPKRHLLTRCLGYERQLQADFTSVKIKTNDKLMLCSDGLTMVVDDKAMIAIINQCRTPDEICRGLMDAALQQGAPDNVTIIVAEFTQE